MIRVVGRLDIKGENLIKGICLEGLRVIGPPNEFAIKYYNEGIDELIYLDTVASLYGRGNLLRVIEETTMEVFVPLIAGGGIRSVEDMRSVLRVGADRVAINTAALSNPNLISEGANTFGTQCIVLSIAAKKQKEGCWECYVEGGRERTGIDVVEWAQKGVELGAGEILLTSIDRDGTLSGFDTELLAAVARNSKVPVIASGGAGTEEDCALALTKGRADALAIGSILHYNKSNIKTIKSYLDKSGFEVRPQSVPA
jgi:imidazole glycerol-phosphate synthase subunit HisF